MIIQLKDHKRKTQSLNVQEFKEHVNSILAHDGFTQDEKHVYCTILERVLLATHNYRGFNNVYWLDKGYREWFNDGRPYENDGSIPDKYFSGEYSRRYD